MQYLQCTGCLYCCVLDVSGSCQHPSRDGCTDTGSDFDTQRRTGIHAAIYPPALCQEGIFRAGSDQRVHIALQRAGAHLTNPNAKIALKWTHVAGDPNRELQEIGADIVSGLDIPQKGLGHEDWGMFRILEYGEREWLASPYWDWGAFYVQIARSILSGEWDSPGFNRKEEKAVNYWWGIANGVIGMELAENIPDGTRTLANLLMEGIRQETVDPFMRKIVSQDGTIRNDGTKVFAPEEILRMEWLCRNVIGSIPEYHALSGKAQTLTRLQGIYRDRMPPEKDADLV